MNVIFSPITKTQGNVATCCFQRIGHNLVAIERDLGGPHTPHMVTVVVFQEIYAPGSEILSILSFVIK